MIKAVLFDWGGVMSEGGRYDGTDLQDKLGSVLEMEPTDAWLIIKPLRDKYNRGLIQEDDIWRHIEHVAGTTVAKTERAIWSTWQTNAPVPDMVRLCKRLKSSGYTVGLLSNTVPNTAAEIRSHGGYNIFDFTVLSYETGYAKPDPEIYRIALEACDGLLSDQVLFIDDQERFLEPAKALGMQTLLGISSAQIIGDVESRLDL